MQPYPNRNHVPFFEPQKPIGAPWLSDGKYQSWVNNYLSTGEKTIEKPTNPGEKRRAHNPNPWHNRKREFISMSLANQVGTGYDRPGPVAEPAPLRNLSADEIGRYTRRAEPACDRYRARVSFWQGADLDNLFMNCSYKGMVERQKTGQLLARGAARHLRQRNFMSLAEFVPTAGLRVDLMALGPKGEIWVIECKSCRADYVSDKKWKGYLEWCDRFFWAVDVDFPQNLLPEDTGVIVADPYDGEIIRNAPLAPLSAARRRKLTLKFARNSAERLLQVTEGLTAAWR